MQKPFSDISFKHDQAGKLADSRQFEEYGKVIQELEWSKMGPKGSKNLNKNFYILPGYPMLPNFLLLTASLSNGTFYQTPIRV